MKLRDERDVDDALAGLVEDLHMDARYLDNLRAEVAEVRAQRDELMATVRGLRAQLEAICTEFENTVEYADWRAAGSKGMSVPFHGDFASVVQLPSAVNRMRWWAREFRKVLEPAK